MSVRDEHSLLIWELVQLYGGVYKHTSLMAKEHVRSSIGPGLDPSKKFAVWLVGFKQLILLSIRVKLMPLIQPMAG